MCSDWIIPQNYQAFRKGLRQSSTIPEKNYWNLIYQHFAELRITNPENASTNPGVRKSFF